MKADLLNHPKGLWICSLTELWEFFSYFGMRALLIYYLTEHFRYSDTESYAIYGAFMALSWSLPLVGGVIADRYLGARKAVVIGAVILVMGHTGMAIEGPAATRVLSATGIIELHRNDFYLQAFYLSLALIVVGVGFIKTNITSLVGRLYPDNSIRRDSGYLIFYFGINLGGAAAPLLCGWLGQTYGWPYGFGLAGLGMLIGLLVFMTGKKYLPMDGETTTRKTGNNYILCVAVIGAVWACGQLMAHNFLLSPLLSAFGLTVGGYLLYVIFFACSPVERSRMLVLFALCALAILFSALYEQMGSSLNLFMDRLVDRKVYGHEINASQMIALAAIFVLILSPLFSVLWVKLGKRRLNPNVPVKVSIGLGFLGLAFMMPVLGVFIESGAAKISLMWPVLMFFFMVCAELCITPIMWSTISTLSPKKLIGTMMGSFFICVAIGSYISGLLAAMVDVDTVNGELLNASRALGAYVSAYTVFGLVSTLTGLLVYLASPFLYRGMQAHDEQHGTSMIGRLYRSAGVRIEPR